MKLPHLTKKGFTLLELLIVIAIIAILIAIALTSLGTVQKRNRDAQRKSDMENVAGALEQWYSDRNVYPESSGGLISTAGCSDAGAGPKDWGSDKIECEGITYLTQLPKEPLQGKSYFYISCEEEQIYVIYTKLERLPDSMQPNPPSDCIPSGNAYDEANNNGTYNYYVSPSQ